eukprot:scaffold1253_cov245-Pinguiococcus_pyrenoidosus.AAC.14
MPCHPHHPLLHPVGSGGAPRSFLCERLVYVFPRDLPLSPPAGAAFYVILVIWFSQGVEILPHAVEVGVAPSHVASHAHDEAGEGAPIRAMEHSPLAGDHLLDHPDPVWIRQVAQADQVCDVVQSHHTIPCGSERGERSSVPLVGRDVHELPLSQIGARILDDLFDRNPRLFKLKVAPAYVI